MRTLFDPDELTFKMAPDGGSTVTLRRKEAKQQKLGQMQDQYLAQLANDAGMPQLAAPPAPVDGSLGPQLIPGVEAGWLDLAPPDVSGQLPPPDAMPQVGQPIIDMRGAVSQGAQPYIDQAARDRAAYEQNLANYGQQLPGRLQGLLDPVLSRAMTNQQTLVNSPLEQAIRGLQARRDYWSTGPWWTQDAVTATELDQDISQLQAQMANPQLVSTLANLGAIPAEAVGRLEPPFMEPPDIGDYASILNSVSGQIDLPDMDNSAFDPLDVRRQMENEVLMGLSPKERAAVLLSPDYRRISLIGQGNQRIEIAHQNLELAGQQVELARQRFEEERSERNRQAYETAQSLYNNLLRTSAPDVFSGPDLARAQQLNPGLYEYANQIQPPMLPAPESISPSAPPAPSGGRIQPVAPGAGQTPSANEMAENLLAQLVLQVLAERGLTEDTATDEQLNQAVDHAMTLLVAAR